MSEKSNTVSAGILQGLKNGFPIGMGYMAVAFGLGITAGNAGLTPTQGFVMSILNHASAGEYAGISAIRTAASLMEVVMLMLIANGRYLLMSASLSQRVAPGTSMLHRAGMGFCITDEIFGLAIASEGYVHPFYMYSSFLIAAVMWASGTALGIIAGNIFPPMVVTALSAAIYGMFLAIILPAAKAKVEIRVVVAVSFIVSAVCAQIPLFAGMSESIRIILLTLVIAGAAAWIHPVDPEEA